MMQKLNTRTHSKLCGSPWCDMLLADINLCLQLFIQFSFHVTEHNIQPIRINSANKISREAIIG